MSQNGTDLAVHDGVEDDRPGAVRLGSSIDLLYHGARFFFGIDVGPRQFDEVDVLELRKEALPEGFGSDAGAIGNKKCRTFHLRCGP
ncbi:hypothetical protein D3C80_1784820 [compost metagenome]